MVCTVCLNRKSLGGYGDPDRTLAVCRLLVGDRDDMVVKALSWALRELVQDVLHQPHRAPLVPAFDALVARAYECGAHAVWLSGSGPTLCWLVEGPLELVEGIGAALVLRWHQEGIAARTQVLSPDHWGGAVHDLPPS